MKVKTSKLTGVALDWAVGTALKLPVEICQIFQYGKPNGKCYISVGETDKDGSEIDFNPSEDWSLGGELIEYKELTVEPIYTSGKIQCWQSYGHDLKYDERGYYIPGSDNKCYGPTPLIAVMRCYVTSIMGDEVDVPEELMK